MVKKLVTFEKQEYKEKALQVKFYLMLSRKEEEDDDIIENIGYIDETIDEKGIKHNI